MTTFDDLDLLPALLAHLPTLGFHTPTPIQAAALPALLRGKDLIVEAPTGAGKTLAFGLSALHQLPKPGARHPSSLILCPTRELAQQVADALRALSTPLPKTRIVLTSGGSPVGPQRDALQRGADIVVATPGRALDLLKRRDLSLQSLRSLILDEADRMLDLGLVPDVLAIAEYAPAERHTSLFSATITPRVLDVSRHLQHHPTTLRAHHEAPPAITELLYTHDPLSPAEAVCRILSHHDLTRAILFTNTRSSCDALCDALTSLGYAASALHGERSQDERDRISAMLHHGSTLLLVATDLAARGLDFPALPAVIQVEPAANAELHTHRIGRTARAGLTGLAISLIPSPPAPATLAHLTQLDAADLPSPTQPPPCPDYATLSINVGHTHHLHPDALSKTLSSLVPEHLLGTITMHQHSSHVAIPRDLLTPTLLDQLQRLRLQQKQRLVITI